MAETYEFKSEARQLLDLMIHSLYSHKEIFLRELISNASDALDKLRIEALKDKALAGSDHVYEIRIEAAKEPRTLTVTDSGAGMSREEIIENLGTIARSGTREFLEQARKADGEGAAAELIGQFGVGFYSSFMAAEEVTVVTRRAGEEAATRWSSRGDGSFEIEEAERDGCGTTVTLKLRPADEENALADFTLNDVLRGTIRKYSDFVTYPIRLFTPRPEGKKEEDDHDEWPTVNSMKPIWARPESEVSAEEYSEFYRHLSHDWRPPLERMRLKAEGTFEYTALLFLPEERPFDLYYRDTNWGLQLYVRRVLIMERSEELLPFYLRFVRGVVESPDLNLNVSREILQKDRRVGKIRNGVVRKVLDTLTGMLTEQREEYLRFWRAFGSALKEGVLHDRDNADRIKALLLFESTGEQEGLTTLAEYVGRMKEGQEEIYYLTGEDRATVEQSPHLEAFIDKGYEVLFWTDPVDELLATSLLEFEGKKLRSIGKGEVELGSEEEREQAKSDREESEKKHASLLERMQESLGEEVSEIRLSTRLTRSAACLVGAEGDLTPQLRRMLEEAGQEVPKTKRILELNPSHAVLEKLQSAFDADAQSPEIDDYARLLYDLALLSEGSAVPDPQRFGELVTRLMVK